MKSLQQVARIVFAFGIMSVGVLTLVYGVAVLLFQPLPKWFPWPNGLGDAAGILMLITGAGLLFERTSRLSIRILLPFLLLWTLSRVPVAIADPGTEISWFAIGEIAVLAAGALVLFVRHAGLREGSRLELATREHGLRVARILYGLSVPTYGLSHFFQFAARTVSLVPPWLPYRRGWAILTGAGQTAAGLGVLFGVYPRVAAMAEAAMLSLFTVLVWIPAVVTKPALHSNWSEFLFTFALAGASWVVAESIPPQRRRAADRA
ncbi:MAG: DoxX family membrane protein [Gemmatimonadaceae bacterium]